VTPAPDRADAPAPPALVVQPAPFLRSGATTPGIMRDVLVGLAPAFLAALWFFGTSALLVVAAATLGAVATEAGLAGNGGAARLRDGSAILPGVLLGLTLPPSLPLWMAALGGVVAIALGKMAWGGLGHNLFNPALVGRAFLQAAFPIALTTWVPPTGGAAPFRGNLALPLLQAAPDAVTAATPLGAMKFQHAATPAWDLFVGNVGGSLGEVSAAAILVGGLWLLVRRAFDWRVPAGMLLATVAIATPLWLAAPARYPSPLFVLLSGGLLFGAVFMATDPVTSPTAPLGAWIFGLGAGALVVVIRYWGGLPEGVMYSILLMNAATPLVERVTQPRAFGRSRR
jgi:electron transport complex protein RnfD